MRNYLRYRKPAAEFSIHAPHKKWGSSEPPHSIEIPSLADEGQNINFSANSITRGTLFLYNGKPVVVVLMLVGLTPHGAGWLPQELAVGPEKFRLISLLPDMPNCSSG